MSVMMKLCKVFPFSIAMRETLMCKIVLICVSNNVEMVYIQSKDDQSQG